MLSLVATVKLPVVLDSISGCISGDLDKCLGSPVDWRKTAHSTDHRRSEFLRLRLRCLNEKASRDVSVSNMEIESRLFHTTERASPNCKLETRLLLRKQSSRHLFSWRRRIEAVRMSGRAVSITSPRCKEDHTDDVDEHLRATEAGPEIMTARMKLLRPARTPSPGTISFTSKSPRNLGEIYEGAHVVNVRCAASVRLHRTPKSNDCL